MRSANRIPTGLIPRLAGEPATSSPPLAAPVVQTASSDKA